MNKKIKALFSLLMVSMLVCATTINVCAADSSEVEPDQNTSIIGLGIDDAENEISSRYVVSCISGQHHMTGRGTGFAYYGSEGSNDLRIRGTASQCDKCNLVLITDYTPFAPGVVWGNYAVWNPGYKLNTLQVVMYTKVFGVSYNNNDPYVQGFAFFA